MHLIIVLTAVVLGAACPLPVCAESGEDHFDLRIQQKWFHQPQFAGYYAAVEKSHFHDAGLNVTRIEGGPHINPTEKVPAGETDTDSFISGSDEAADWKWLLYILLATGLVTLLIAVAFVKIRTLNRKLAAENETRLALEKELKALAVTDFSTGVFNRSGFLEALEHELSRSDRNETPLSLLEFDLDYFKQINDAYGHAVGDQALSMVASLCQNSIRGIDIIGRMGGEEFMIALPDTNTRGAFIVATRLLEHIQASSLTLDDGRRVTMTFSIGVITRRLAEDVESMMRRADRAMYQAKDQGRNRVCVKENPDLS